MKSLRLLGLAALLALSGLAFGGPLLNEPVVGVSDEPSPEETIYRCYRDPHYEYPVCKKVDIEADEPAQPTLEQQAEVAAAQRAALFALPVRATVRLLEGSPTELCSSTTHGASGCCRVVGTLPDGDVIIECGRR